MKISIETDLGPFHILAEQLAHAARAIAPERDAEFDERMSAVEVIVSDNVAWQLHTAFGSIRMSAGVLQSVWALAYAYWTLYQPLIGRSAGEGSAIVPATPALEDAIRLFAFAQARAKGANAPWPDDFPLPATPSTEARTANQLLLGAMAAFLLHEFHHIDVAAPMDEAGAGLAVDIAAALDEERDADAFAADWLLAGARDGIDRAKRTLSLAIASLILAGHWLTGTASSDDLHPPGPKRLISILAPHLPPSDPAWAVVMVMLALHAQMATPSVTVTGPYDTFHEAVIALVAALAAV
jgi:hypothetical protein